MGKQRILVVDDDEPLLASVKQMLELAGYETDLATTAHEALLKAETRAYGLALLDMVLPDMQGTELLEQLRVNIPSIRIIMVTGSANTENAIKSLNLGANAYLTKPVNPDELLDTIETNFEQIQKEVERAARDEAIKSSLYEKEVLIKELQQNSTFFETLLRESPTALVFVDSAATIILINNSAQALLGYKNEEIIGDRLSILVADEEEVTKTVDERDIRSTFFHKSGAEVPICAHIAVQYYKKGDKGFLITLHDLSESRGLFIKPTSAAPVDSKSLTSLEHGAIFLVQEERPRRSIKIFKDLVGRGSQGLLISRQRPSLLNKTHHLEQTPSIWLTRNKSIEDNCIAPDELTKLYKTIENFIVKADEGVIFFEGFEYLLAQNGFQPLLRFFQSLNDLMMVSPSRLIIALDSLALDVKEMHLLKRDMLSIPD